VFQETTFRVEAETKVPVLCKKRTSDGLIGAWSLGRRVI